MSTQQMEYITQVANSKRAATFKPAANAMILRTLMYLPSLDCLLLPTKFLPRLPRVHVREATLPLGSAAGQLSKVWDLISHDSTPKVRNDMQL